MTATTFDTLEFEKQLERAGFNETQAEALTKAIAKIISSDEIVTKTHLDARLAELKYDLIKWMLGFLVAQSAIIISCIKLIH